MYFMFFWLTPGGSWQGPTYSSWKYNWSDGTAPSDSASFSAAAGQNRYNTYSDVWAYDAAWNPYHLTDLEVGSQPDDGDYYDIPPPPPVINSFTVSGGGQGPASSITVPVNTLVTFNWSTSGTGYSCSSNGDLGFNPSVPLQGPFGPVTATQVGGPFYQKLFCSNAGGGVSMTVSVTVFAPPPATPAAPTVSPEPSFNNQVITFSWSGVSGATYYVVETDSGPCVSGNCFPGDVKSMTSSGYSVGGHWVQVKACNTSGCSAYSPRANFTVQGPPATAPTVSPDIDAGAAGVQQRHGDTTTISWAAVPGASSYVVYVVSSSGGVSACKGGCPLAGTQLGPAGNQLTVSAGTFSVSLAACNAAGCSTPSPSVDLIVQSNDAAFVSEVVKNRTIPPDQPAVNVNGGRPFHAEVTLRNTGTATWDTVGEYVLRSKNPDGNATWGGSEITLAATSPLVSSVPPNATVTFAGDLPAPATAGTYNFQWQLYRKTNAFGYFGVPSTNVAITVPGQQTVQPIQVRLQIRARQHLDF
ncbi:hypothetical protein HY573_01150 [Candidatus Parcubacteria bacterium]|nr:hypothetical protein [Candidatus Parcubacteria bacterium]